MIETSDWSRWVFRKSKFTLKAPLAICAIASKAGLYACAPTHPFPSCLAPLLSVISIHSKITGVGLALQ